MNENVSPLGYLQIADDLEQEADKLEAWIRGQSSFYLQYEDQGATSMRIGELRRIASNWRKRASDSAGDEQRS